ncbi:uncharacterized protein GJ701_015021 [Geothlypis trichas]
MGCCEVVPARALAVFVVVLEGAGSQRGPLGSRSKKKKKKKKKKRQKAVLRQSTAVAVGDSLLAGNGPGGSSVGLCGGGRSGTGTEQAGEDAREGAREQQAELSGLPTSPDEGRMSSPQGHPGGDLARSEQSVEQTSEELSRAVQEHPGDSDSTREDAETPEEPLLNLPSELSVLDRLGLHRVALTEQDLEAAFAHLALAFRCDLFTLQQRVQVERRARDAAEENIQEELGQCRAALERLGRSCASAGCKETLEQLQHNLAVLAAAVERATSAAEKLGAVHQEARMSRAAEVMVQHVENLKRHHLREHAELEEMKRLIQQNSRNRQLAESQDDVEPRLRPHPLKRTFQQGSARRRVSIAVIPKQLLVPALRAEQPQQVTRSQRGPSTGPAPPGVSWSHRASTAP